MSTKPRCEIHGTYFGIYQRKSHDFSGDEKPQFASGWYDNIDDAKNDLDRLYDGGKKKRHDNDLYHHHYTYWYEIYAFDDSIGQTPDFYDMGDYYNDLVNSGKWLELSDEQRQLIISFSPMHTKLRYLFSNPEDKIK